MALAEEDRLDHKLGFIIKKNGILECYSHPADEVGIEQARYSSGERVKFSEGESYPCLFDITSVKEFTGEARNYLANEGNDLVLASAILTNSPVSKMIGNFFIAVNKPKNPTRIFTSKENALEWLEQFKYVSESSSGRSEQY